MLAVSCVVLLAYLLRAAGAARTVPVSLVSRFDSFVSQHGRAYKRGSAEYSEREALFARRVAEVELRNNRTSRRWTAGINAFSDWTEAELARLLGRRGVANLEGSASGSDLSSARGSGFLVRKTVKNASIFAHTRLPLPRGNSSGLPEEKSWAHLSSSKQIWDQGACGSCWAIATSMVLQAHAEIYKSKQKTFSVQQMVSCIANPRKCGGNGGCQGATMELAMDYVMKNGCAENHEIPYEGVDTKCPTILAANHHSAVGDATSPAKSSAGADFGMQGWAKLPENKYEPVLHALVHQGPVGVSVAATHWFQYRGGVFDYCDKDAIIDHAVVLIGYGKTTIIGDKFYLIQNSWGKAWGEDGNMRLLRRDNEETYCGINNKPELGTGCVGGPPEVRVCGTCGVLYDSVVPEFSRPTR